MLVEFDPQPAITDESGEFVSGSLLERRMKISPTALKTAALKGIIKHRTTAEGSVTFSLADVKAWLTSNVGRRANARLPSAEENDRRPRVNVLDGASPRGAGTPTENPRKRTDGPPSIWLNPAWTPRHVTRSIPFQAISSSRPR